MLAVGERGEPLAGAGGEGEPLRGAAARRGAPLPAAAAQPGGPLLCAVPPDIEAMRREDPALARSWRLALRETLVPALDAGGWRIAGFRRPGWYVLVETVEDGTCD